MKTKSTPAHKVENAYFISVLNKAVEFNDAFLEMTGYAADEIINKDLFYLFTNMLKLAPDAIEQINSKGIIICYMFTKDLNIREVTIILRKQPGNGGNQYIFKQIPDSYLDDKTVFIDQIFLNSIIGCAILSIPGLIVLKANERFLHFLNIPNNKPENCIGKNINEIMTGLTGLTGLQSDMDWKTTQKSLIFKEVEYDSSSRGVAYWSIIRTPIYIKEQMKYIMASVVEVTENVLAKKLAEDQAKIIEQKNNQLETILENLSETVSVMDKDGNYLLVGSKLRDYPEPLTPIAKAGCTYRKGIYFDIKGNPLPLEKLPVIRILNGETIIQERLVLKSIKGTFYFNVKGAPVYDTNGNYEMGICCYWDITEQVQAENKLKAVKDHLSRELSAMNCLHDISIHSVNKVNVSEEFNEIINTVISITNADIGCILLYDEQINTLDIIAQHGLSQPLLDSFNTIHLYPDSTDMLIKLEERVTIEDLETSPLTHSIPRLQIILSSGIRTFQSTPIFNRSGKLLGVLATCYRDPHHLGERESILLDMLALLIADIIGHLQLEINKELLIKAEKDKNEALQKAIEMKDEFLTLISHEFKTPLTVINSAIQAMEFLCKEELSDKAKGFLNKIRQNSYRQLRLVNNLLDITRFNAGRLYICKTNKDIIFLTNSIIESVQIYAQEKGVKLVFSSTIKEKIIGIDEEKYERILLNLLSNAIKFTPKSKSIAVNIFQKIIDRKCMIHIQIKDEGIGIPQIKQKLIFEKFGQVDNSLTRQSEGTGIGLYLVKTLIESLCGSITLESKVGHGSTFNIMLPAIKTKESLTGKKMKVINDNRLIKTTAVEFSDIYL